MYNLHFVFIIENTQVSNCYLFVQTRRPEAWGSAVERERRECGGGAPREGRRAAQGRHFQRQTGCQVDTDKMCNIICLMKWLRRLLDLIVGN